MEFGLWIDIALCLCVTLLQKIYILFYILFIQVAFRNINRNTQTEIYNEIQQQWKSTPKRDVLSV